MSTNYAYHEALGRTRKLILNEGEDGGGLALPDLPWGENARLEAAELATLKAERELEAASDAMIQAKIEERRGQYDYLVTKLLPCLISMDPIVFGKTRMGGLINVKSSTCFVCKSKIFRRISKPGLVFLRFESVDSNGYLCKPINTERHASLVLDGVCVDPFCGALLVWAAADARFLFALRAFEIENVFPLWPHALRSLLQGKARFTDTLCDLVIRYCWSGIVGPESMRALWTTRYAPNGRSYLEWTEEENSIDDLPSMGRWTQVYHRLADEFSQL